MKHSKLHEEESKEGGTEVANVFHAKDPKGRKTHKREKAIAKCRKSHSVPH